MADGEIKDERSRIPESWVSDNPKKSKKGKKGKKNRASANPQGVDLGAVFGGKEGFLQKGLESNWGERKIPKEKQSDLDWIQEHGPVGNVKGDGTKATRPEIVRANQNELNRRISEPSGFDQAGFDAKKATLQGPGVTKGDEAFRVAFGLPGTKESGQPVGYATKPGGTLPVAPMDEKLNQTGNFTNAERGQISQRVAEAPGVLANMQPQQPQAPMSAQEQVSMLPGGSPVDLGAVFPPQPGGTSIPTAPAVPQAPAAPSPQTTTFTPPSAEEEQIRRFGKPYSQDTFNQSPVGRLWQYLQRNLGQKYTGAQ